MGADEGSTLRYVGLLRKLVGNKARAALIAACTSRAAPLMSRLMSNISVMRVDPSVLRELISSSPAIVPNDCSSGIATLEAMVSGLAPANRAVTEIMGKSICGKGATGRKIRDIPPANTHASQISVVATGRTTKIESHLMRAPPVARHQRPG